MASGMCEWSKLISKNGCNSNASGNSSNGSLAVSQSERVVIESE